MLSTHARTTCEERLEYGISVLLAREEMLLSSSNRALFAQVTTVLRTTAMLGSVTPIRTSNMAGVSSTHRGQDAGRRRGGPLMLGNDGQGFAGCWTSSWVNHRSRIFALNKGGTAAGSGSDTSAAAALTSLDMAML